MFYVKEKQENCFTIATTLFCTTFQLEKLKMLLNFVMENLLPAKNNGKL